MTKDTFPDFEGVANVLQRYFDGLYESDTSILADVFHPQALYCCASEGTLQQLSMDAYFAVVDKRPSPASHGEVRCDRILSIEFAGPVTAFARVNCAIGPKYFTDFLTFVHIDGAWRIVSKVFHFDIVSAGSQ